MNLELDVKEAVAGVDWLTVTCADEEKADLLREVVYRTTDTLEKAGNFRRPWGKHGYQGWSCGSLRYGERQDGVIAILSGAAAALGWAELMHYRTNATRVDLATTFELERPYPDVAKVCHQYLCDMRDRKEKTPVDTFPLIDGHHRGQTLYVGSRKSDQFGRLYDKGLESNWTDKPGLWWRYEVQYKRHYANQVADQLYADYLGNGDITRNIATTVNHWFTTRLVPCAGDHWNRPYSVQVESKISDIDATLEWFSRQVRPSVRRLFAAGVPVERIVKALGVNTDLGSNT